jgi:hypothetical protein
MIGVLQSPIPAAWGFDEMKRPQFSLRLILLVVTLAATIFAWRHAVGERKRAETEMQQASAETPVAALENWLVKTHYDDVRHTPYNLPQVFTAMRRDMISHKPPEGGEWRKSVDLSEMPWDKWSTKK